MKTFEVKIEGQALEDIETICEDSGETPASLLTRAVRAGIPFCWDLVEARKNKALRSERARLVSHGFTSIGIPKCHCGGAAAVESISINGEPRHRVRCFKCNSMTMHKPTAGDARGEWCAMLLESEAKKKTPRNSPGRARPVPLLFFPSSRIPESA